MVGDPTEEILTAAGRLFAERGIAGTTMAGLAAEVGLKQSSLYYYFRSRDEVVAALVARANVVPLELARSLAAAEGSAAARLHRFVRGDVEALCRLPLDINELHRVASADRERFADYWAERRRLERFVAGIVADGVAAGQFRPVQPKLTSLLVLGNDEGVQNWFRHEARRRPTEVSKALADLTVGGLLADGEAIEAVAAEAAALALPS